MTNITIDLGKKPFIQNRSNQSSAKAIGDYCDAVLGMYGLTLPPPKLMADLLESLASRINENMGEVDAFGQVWTIDSEWNAPILASAYHRRAFDEFMRNDTKKEKTRDGGACMGQETAIKKQRLGCEAPPMVRLVGW